MLSLSKLLTRQSSVQARTTCLAASQLSTHRPSLATQQMWGVRGFTAQKQRNHSGMAPYEFDYSFERQVDKGNFPHEFRSYMKVIGHDYDTNSE